ncbi:uncharacterized protein LOC130648445 [Hydractinia symbiolongicarpus]|uniref:uncharacterized protein LOC130648445 n=1 Tax=Hydractinia symbiolongicarpus TaxID=13093 RepID=UPI00254C7F06|nr:uncharacterized protein LOC130648445 [Hydractinia symbiolongicarpus]
MEYKVEYVDSIDVEEVQRLRAATGLRRHSTEGDSIASRNSICDVVAKTEAGEVVGMGRLIGDGGTFCVLTNVCVLPEHQRKGVGTMVMEKIASFMEEKLPKNCFICLLSTPEGKRFYEKFGYTETSAINRTAMFMRT